MSGTYLGIDVGTSGVKAIVIDETGKALADATASIDVSRPAPGWSEQDPTEWWRATLQTVDEISRTDPQALAQVRGLGLSGQMHGATLLGKGGEILRPCILWNDARSMAECAEFEATCPQSRELCGNIAMPGFTAPKVLWVKNHEPEIFERLDKILLPKAYVRYLLSGEMIEDMSDASGTLWLNVAKREWSEDLLAATGLSRDNMPALAEGSAPAGTLKKELRERWGITGEVVIAGGGGDNAASACGIGAIRPGEGFVSLGTSGVIFVSNEKFRPNTEGAVHAFCHALPDTWHQMGVVLAAADALNWLAATPARNDARIITPHPGEAARLLGSTAAAVQEDRRAALDALAETYGGTVVLKGAGSLVSAAADEAPWLCSAGNPGMASAGMGDVLTGVIAGLLAQGLALPAAAAVGVEAHARAGDRAAARGERGLIASDLLGELRGVINP